MCETPSLDMKNATPPQPIVDRRLMRCRLVLILCVGVSFSWFGVTLLGIQTPVWQRETPFSFCSSAYIGVTSHGAVVAAIMYLILLFRRPQLAAEGPVVLALLCLQLVSVVLVAALWRAWPPVILLASSFCGAVGNLSNIIAVPWAARLDDGAGAPALLLGNKLGALAASFVGFGQQPGAARLHFGASLFLVVFTFPVALSLAAFAALERSRVHVTVHELAVQDVAMLPPPRALPSPPPRHAPPPAEAPLHVAATSGAVTRRSSWAHLPFRVREAWRLHVHEAWPLMACLGWVNFHAWGLQPSLLPYATRNTDPSAREVPGGSGAQGGSGAGAETLQYTILVSVTALSLGAAAPFLLRLRCVCARHRVTAAQLQYRACHLTAPPATVTGTR